MVAYGYDAFLKFNAVRSGALAQGERVVTKSSSTVTSPAYWNGAVSFTTLFSDAALYHCVDWTINANSVDHEDLLEYTPVVPGNLGRGWSGYFSMGHLLRFVGLPFNFYIA